MKIFTQYRITICYWYVIDSNGSFYFELKSCWFSFSRTLVFKCSDRFLVTGTHCLVSQTLLRDSVNMCVTCVTIVFTRVSICSRYKLSHKSNILIFKYLEEWNSFHYFIGIIIYIFKKWYLISLFIFIMLLYIFFSKKKNMYKISFNLKKLFL